MLFHNRLQNDVNQFCKYCLVCVDDQCSWYFKSSSLNNSNIFKVRKFYNVHTCGNESRFFSQRHATSKFVGGLYRAILTILRQYILQPIYNVTLEINMPLI